MQKPNFQFYDFIKPAFADTTQHTIIRAWRRTGKTFWAFQWILLKLMQNKGKRGLWVDTVQGNLWKYIERYVRPIMGDFWESVHVDNQKYIITFLNGSTLDMGSAERPENLEGFWYDYYVLNEAGIILKKKGLWDNTIQPMVRNAQGKIIGTPKWKSHDGEIAKYMALSELAKEQENWKEYQYKAEDSPEYTKEELEVIKAQVPSYIWLQEYLAEFVDVYEGSIINSEDLRYFEHASLDDFDALYMHADTTHTGKTTSDYFSLWVLWESKKDKNFYMLDFVLKKCDVETQARASIVMYQKFQSRVKKFTYDEKANQWFWFWIKKLAKEEYGISLPIEELKYPNDKITHFEPHVPHFKANRLYLPSNNPMITTATDQLLAFPTKWVNDDFVDLCSWLLDNFTKPVKKWLRVYNV
jgi:predicted phage terminase large subunit-like protein